MTENQYKSPGVTELRSTSDREPVPRRAWVWFVLGFAIVFVVVACCVTMYSMHPSGGSIVQCRLWQYYVLEFQKQIGPSTLGPASGGGGAAIQTLIMHMFISAIGGGVAIGSRSLIFRRKR